MATQAKVVCIATQKNEPIPLFKIIGLIEGELNKLVKAEAERLRRPGQRMSEALREHGLSKAVMTVHPYGGSEAYVTASFCLKKGDERTMYVHFNPPEQAVAPGYGAVLLSLGMAGPYREILLRCGKAISRGRSFRYSDDLSDGFSMISNHADEISIA